MTPSTLEDYCDAWNAHDIDRIMAHMTDDCVFETGGGQERFGTRYQGSDTVRERFLEVFRDIPDVRFETISRFAAGNHACWEWTLIGTRPNGESVELDGCDLFTFVGDKISSKRSYVKNRS